MAIRQCVRIKDAKCIATGVYEMLLLTPQMAEQAKAGQFISIYSNDGSRLLPRPISICEVCGDCLRVVYRVAGKGTEEFSKMKAGEYLDVQGPLGNGYTISEKKALILGGGIGIPPMLQLAKSINAEKEIVLGYRDELFLNDDFGRYGHVTIATEDGSCGTKGNVLDAIKERGLKGEVIYACGPMPMLRAVKRYAEDNNMEAYISLEEKMACGIGACLACVCKTTKKDEHSQVNNTRICKEGPVFDAREVDI